MGPPIVTKLTSDFVWQYFTICPDDENSPSRSKAICKECNVIIKRGNDPKKYSIHPLKRHLRAKHEIIWGELPHPQQHNFPSQGQNASWMITANTNGTRPYGHAPFVRVSNPGWTCYVLSRSSS